MKKILIIIILLILVALAGIGLVSLFKKDSVPNNISVTKNNGDVVSEKVNIEKTASEKVENNFGNKNLYVSPKYGISFSYPSGWHEGTDNDFKNGTIQLVNYDMRNSEGGSFGAGQNKIEAVMVSTGAIDSFMAVENGLKEDRTITNVTVANTIVAKRIRSIVTNEGAPVMETLSYIIPILKTKDSNIVFTMYGGASNYSVLDELVLTIKFTN